MADVTRKVKAKGGIDANSCWWVSELLAADCKKAWLHPGWEDTRLRWYNWLYDMKKKYEGKRMEAEHQKHVSRMIGSDEGGTGVVYKISKPSAERGGVQILMKEEEDANQAVGQK